MSKRDNPIAISSATKRQLDAVAREAYDTEAVPYGVVVARLCDEFEGQQVRSTV